MHLISYNGATGFVFRVSLRDANNAPVTGILRTDTNLYVSTILDNESTAVTCRGNTAIADIATLGVWADPTNANVRWKEVDSTNQPGLYEVQLPNNRLTNKPTVLVPPARNLHICIRHAGGSFIQQDIDVQLAGHGLAIDSMAVEAANAAEAALKHASFAQSEAERLHRKVDYALEILRNNFGISATDTTTTVEAIKAKTDLIPAAGPASAASWTAALATNLGTRVDTTISSRSTYSGADTSGTTTLLSRLTSGRAGYLDKLNVTGTLANTDNASLFKADVSGLATPATVWSHVSRTLTSGTSGGATAQEVWEFANRQLTAVADSSGVTTLLGRLTSNRAGYLDKLNVTGTLANTDNAASFKADVSGIAADLTAVKAKTDLIPAGGPAAATSYTQARAAKLDYLDMYVSDVSSGGGGTGAGPRTVTITVNDGNAIIQGASISVTAGAERFTNVTGQTGQAVFNLTDSTWTVAIAKAGYSFTGASLVVNGDETATYSMTQVSSFPPVAPGLCAARVTIYDTNGNIEPGLRLQYHMYSGPGDQGESYPRTTEYTDASDANGLITVPLVQGTLYRFRRDLGDWVIQDVPLGTSSLWLNPILGRVS